MRRRDLMILGSCSLTAGKLFAISLPDYPARPAKSYLGALSVAGFIVGIDPVTDPSAQQKYFHVNFAKKRFLPIFISLDNQSPSDSFFVRQGDIGIFVGDQEKANSGQVVSGRSHGGEKVMLVSSLALSLGGELIAMHMMVRATEIRQNIIKKELRSLTLAPAETGHGFVYLPIPGDAKEAGSLRLRIRVKKLLSDDPIDFEFSLAQQI